MMASHEPDAVDVRRLYWIAAVLGAGLLLTVAGMYWLSIVTFDRSGYRHVVGYRPPAPRLQVRPRDDLVMLRAREDARLHSYAWTDRAAGTARIPIERAMALLAAQRANGRPETAK